MKLFSKQTNPQLTPDEWKQLWQSLVPAQSRDVPIAFNGRTETAFVCLNHNVMMLQDGLLMEPAFFDVCEHFQKAGYHVTWLMRCIQDVENGYLKAGKRVSGDRLQWTWKSPTTNFGRWTSDNFNATILLQYRQLPPGDPMACTENILQRVTWAESDKDEEMVPGRTVFYTVPTPGTPAALLQWLSNDKPAGLR